VVEIWKDIKNIQGYQISNHGRIKNKNTSRILKPWLHDGRYYRIKLRKKAYRIHRLVAETFIDNPSDKSEVNHINGDKLDNRADNLEWVTPEENAAHAIENKLIKNSYSKEKVNGLAKACFETEKTPKQIAREFNVSLNVVYRIMNKQSYKFFINYSEYAPGVK